MYTYKRTYMFIHVHIYIYVNVGIHNIYLAFICSIICLHRYRMYVCIHTHTNRWIPLAWTTTHESHFDGCPHGWRIPGDRGGQAKYLHAREGLFASWL